MNTQYSIGIHLHCIVFLILMLFTISIPYHPHIQTILIKYYAHTNVNYIIISHTIKLQPMAKSRCILSFYLLLDCLRFYHCIYFGTHSLYSYYIYLIILMNFYGSETLKTRRIVSIQRIYRRSLVKINTKVKQKSNQTYYLLIC